MTLHVVEAAAISAGVATAVGVWALLGRGGAALPAAVLLERRRPARSEPVVGWRRFPVPTRPLQAQLDRAGWSETPERYLLLAAGLVLTTAAVGAALGVVIGDVATGVALTLAGAASGAAAAYHLLRTAVSNRRERLLAELAPTLDLVGIELSAGASPLSALTSVTRHGRGELARELKTVLTTSAISADRAVDARLQELGERLDLPPLVALATILATSRDYGSGVSHGIRAIAIDLRRARRRDLIAQSRRALSRILLPAAVGVLLPFLAVLLYPAVTALSASFR